jgi:hypothetical protein
VLATETAFDHSSSPIQHSTLNICLSNLPKHRNRGPIAAFVVIARTP